MNLNDLKTSSVEELSSKATELGLEARPELGSSELILAILRAHTKAGGTVTSSGTLEILSDGFGFLRGSPTDYSPSPQDIYVSPSQIRRFHLNTGDEVSGQVRPPKETERYFALLRVQTINGVSADKATTSQGFTERKAIRSSELLHLEHTSIQSRLFDLLCPIGKGQRTLVFAPPRCRPSDLVLELAKAAQHTHKDLEVVCLLIAQRPELISEFQDAGIRGVVSSTFDEQAQRHTQITDIALENAKRAADSGRDVLILVDSLTRLASAASLCAPSTASNLPAGLSVKGLQATKRLFAAGRNLDDAGSVTLIAILRDGGDEIDNYLRHELSSAANCLVQLSTEAASQGCKLPIAVDRSENGDEGRLLDGPQQDALAKLRERLSVPNAGAALKALDEELAKSKDNKKFLSSL